MRAVAYVTLALVQGFGLGVAQADGQWIIFVLVILSIIIMFLYLAGDAIRDIEEWRQDDDAVMRYLNAIGMTYLAPAILKPKDQS